MDVYKIMTITNSCSISPRTPEGTIVAGGSPSDVSSAPLLYSCPPYQVADCRPYFWVWKPVINRVPGIVCYGEDVPLNPPPAGAIAWCGNGFFNNPYRYTIFFPCMATQGDACCKVDSGRVCCALPVNSVYGLAKCWKSSSYKTIPAPFSANINNQELISAYSGIINERINHIQRCNYYFNCCGDNNIIQYKADYVECASAGQPAIFAPPAYEGKAHASIPLFTGVKRCRDEYNKSTDISLTLNFGEVTDMAECINNDLSELFLKYMGSLPSINGLKIQSQAKGIDDQLFSVTIIFDSSLDVDYENDPGLIPPFGPFFPCQSTYIYNGYYVLYNNGGGSYSLTIPIDKNANTYNEDYLHLRVSSNTISFSLATRCFDMVGVAASGVGMVYSAPSAGYKFYEKDNQLYFDVSYSALVFDKIFGIRGVFGSSNNHPISELYNTITLNDNVAKINIF